MLVLEVGELSLEILFYTLENLDYILNMIIEYILDNVQNDVVTDHFDEFEYIGCNLYYMAIESTLVHDELDLSYLLDEFNIKANVSIEIDIYNKTYFEGVESLKGLVNKIVDTIKSDIIVFDESSGLIFKKYSDKYFIDNSFWKSDLKL